MASRKSVIGWGITDGDFRPFGNGKQFQYPIFYTKKEAVEYRRENVTWLSTSIIKVRITPITTEKPKVTLNTRCLKCNRKSMLVICKRCSPTKSRKERK